MPKRMLGRQWVSVEDLDFVGYDDASLVFAFPGLPDQRIRITPWEDRFVFERYVVDLNGLRRVLENGQVPRRSVLRTRRRSRGAAAA